MQAVIMAGGRGTRLSSVLKDIPKPMVNFAGRPLLAHQIENLRSNGITDIILVIGYLGEVIREYFGDGRKFGVNINYFTETEPLGTAGALYYLKEQLTEDFLLVFGDLYFDINFRRFYDFHKSKNARMTLYAHPNSHPCDSDLIVANKDGVITAWSFKNTERPDYYNNLVNAGVYVISPSILGKIPPGRKTDLEKDFIVPSISEGRIYAYRSTEYVKDIGTPERLRKAEADFQSGITGQRNLEKKQKCIFLDRDGTVNRHVGFLQEAEQMVLESSAAEAIRLINESEYLAIIISNQPVIARGECTLEELEHIHERMYALLGQEGAYVDDLYFCPHHPDRGFKGEIIELKVHCNCRKPGTGMIERAAQEHNLDLQASWIIGDTTVDIQTGRNAGLKTGLVLTGEAGRDGKYDVKPDLVQKDLLSCVKHILNKVEGEHEEENEGTDQGIF